MSTPNRAQRALIDRQLSLYGALVGLDETHPEGDSCLEGLWVVAEIGADSAGFSGPAVDQIAADRVALALLVANYGVEFIAELGARS